MAPPDLHRFLQPTEFVDSDHPVIVDRAEAATAGTTSQAEAAAALFTNVRDGVRYDPYSMSADPDQYRASTVAEAPAAFCIPKAVLLAALARASGIPARLGFADVRNHLSSPKLTARMGTDLFVFHGYTDLHVDGRWLKATSAFNAELCHRAGVAPLEFDGVHDALLHPFDGEGRQYMTYERDRGTYADLPFTTMVDVMRSTYGETVFSTRSQRDELFDG